MLKLCGNLNIVEDLKLRDILSKGPKYREPTIFSWKYNFKLVMDSVENYATRWANQEEVGLDPLSEWIKSIRHLLKCRMYMAGRSINNKPKSVLSDTDVTEHLADLHKYNRYIIVPADKSSNNVVFVCKTYYFECLQRELDLDDSISKSTFYQQTAFSKDEILASHRSFLSSFGIDTVGKDTGLPLLYWIPKLHRDPCKQRFIVGLSSCSTKPLSKLLTSILTIKDGLQKYCDIVYSRSGINQM